jgi:hypothetical protein
MASGELSDEEFIEFIRSSLQLSAAHCKDGALL